MGSVNGRILLGLLDVIRCGIQKYRVFRVLKSLKRNACTDLKVSIRYDYFPSKLKKKKKFSSPLLDEDIGSDNHAKRSEKMGGKNVDNDSKIDGKLSTIKKMEEDEKQEEEQEGKEEKERKEEKEGETASDSGVVPSHTDSEKGKTVEIKEETKEVKEVKDEKTIIEDKRMELLKSKRERDDNIRSMRKDFMTEFLLSEKAEFFVTFPDCCLLISATSRYGFQLKSVVSAEASDQFPSFMDHYDKNKGLGSINGLDADEKIKTETSKDSLTCFPRHCDTLYHPISVRLDRTQELVRSLDSLVMGSCLR